MGLDAYLYCRSPEDEGEPDDEHHRVIQRAITMAGIDPNEVKITEAEQEEEDHNFGRAYDMRLFADFVRSEGLAMPHASRMSLSRWEVILPVGFENPVQLFPGGASEMEAFGLPPWHEKWNEPEKAIEEYTKQFTESLGGGTVLFGLGSRGGPYGFPGYLAYYLGTRAEDIYCLSAVALLKEMEGFFLSRGLLKQEPGSEGGPSTRATRTAGPTRFKRHELPTRIAIRPIASNASS